MDISKGIPSPIDTDDDEFFENLDTCILCGTKLNFHYVTDYKVLEVQEEAHCKACNIRNKINKHKLH